MSLFDVNHKLRKNILFSTLSRFGVQILAVLSNFIFARALGVAGFGEYAFVSAILMIGNAITTFGTDMVIIRKISAEDDYSELSHSLIIQLFISSVILFIVFILHLFSIASISILIYTCSLIPLSFFTVSTIALRGSQNIDAFSMLHFILGVFQFISAIIIFSIQGNLFQLVLLLLTSHFLSAIVSLILCNSRIPKFRFFLKPSFGKIINLIQLSFPLALIGSLRLLYERLSLILLPTFTNLFFTGLFSASARIMDAVRLGYISALTPIYPEMARDKNFLSLQSGLRLLLASSIFLSLTISLLAKYIIMFLFGLEFLPATNALQVIAWGVPFYVIVSYYSLGFLAIELERPVLISLIVSLLGLLTMLIVLTQLYGLVGGAFAVLSAEILQAGLLFIQWRKYAIPKLS